ncbi:MAG: tetratricopeptide repeat protein [Spirochaetaceae bacterium]|nr:tetratricopeptide repeat protein [Spirochaetaceae bacterium]
MNDKIFYNNKGAELSALGKYDEAEANFKLALELAPGDYFVLYNIGFVLLKKGDKKEFKKWFDLAFDNASMSTTPDALNLKRVLALDCGLACFDAELYSEAEKYYDIAFSLGESSAEYWNRTGVLSFITEKYEKAKKCFEKAVSLEPEHADALYNLADTYDELNLPEKASDTRAKYSALVDGM